MDFTGFIMLGRLAFALTFLTIFARLTNIDDALGVLRDPDLRRRNESIIDNRIHSAFVFNRI